MFIAMATPRYSDQAPLGAAWVGILSLRQRTSQREYMPLLAELWGTVGHAGL